MADFNQNDLRDWASGGDAGGAPAGGEGGSAAGGGAPEEEEGGENEDSTKKDPCEVLRQGANEVEEGMGIVTSVTLPDDEDKALAKRWDQLQEDLQETVDEMRELADDLEAAHEDDDDEEDEEDDDEGDEEDDDEGDEEDDDEGDEKSSKGEKKNPFGGK